MKYYPCLEVTSAELRPVLSSDNLATTDLHSTRLGDCFWHTYSSFCQTTSGDYAQPFKGRLTRRRQAKRLHLLTTPEPGLW